MKQRRMALEKCVQKIANHSVLNKDPDLRLFLESDTFSLDVSAFLCCTAYKFLSVVLSVDQASFCCAGWIYFVHWSEFHWAAIPRNGRCKYMLITSTKYHSHWFAVVRQAEIVS